ncbi:disulfide bond formation protein B [Savagea sp. SN6]|uniref:Disulfide bond formation protein B n=1 Tax=Savagea serpentis TaxID=2785297 RepID=A0A8J7GD31_9BACL|nr:disulfide oxidoreductase [Savagea serpentis]MBF4501975.1 disulfide bond formation protein B [Savagea serpentis]
MNKKSENTLLSMWILAMLATIGSLYYSEVLGFVPCTYCWYQRILMYPLVIIIGVAIAQKDKRVAITTAIFSGLGTALAAYHYALQKLSILRDNAPSCGDGVPCTAQYVNYFGFVTIPALSLIAFSLIFILSIRLIKMNKQ